MRVSRPRRAVIAAGDRLHSGVDLPHLLQQIETEFRISILDSDCTGCLQRRQASILPSPIVAGRAYYKSIGVCSQ